MSFVRQRRMNGEKSERGRRRAAAGAAVLLFALLTGVWTFREAVAFVTAQGQQTPPPPASVKAAVAALPGTFTNPIITSRDTADPWLVYRNGFYYFTFTVGRSIEVWQSPTITGLDAAKKVTVWRAPETGPNAHHVWAPEIHFVKGKWYIYYTATPGGDPDRRQFALEAATDDPLGPYIDRGKVFVEGDDHYAIDGSIYERKDGSLYYLWSGRETSERGPQNIYIAPMSNPYTISGPRTLLSTPSYPWERHGWAVNEGPEVLERNGKTVIIYSASGGTTPHYALGMLTNTDGNLLKAESWTKSPVPIFFQYKGPDGEVYTPGHNGFCKSPDGTEDWIVYHGKNKADNTWAGRTARAQRFYWNPDDTPNFGHPIPPGVRLAVPSGEPGSKALPDRGQGTGLIGRYFAGPTFTDLKMTRTDPMVAFDWRLESPAKGIGVDGFSARWQGRVQPRFTETYTFQTFSDDGIRVWVDGRKIIDNWTAHAPTTDRGAIALEAGKKYDIKVEYFEKDNTALLQLAWSSLRQPFEVIPKSRLYPPAATTTAKSSPFRQSSGTKSIRTKVR